MAEDTAEARVDSEAVRVKGRVTSIKPDNQAGKYRIDAELLLNLEGWPVSGVSSDHLTKVIHVHGTTSRANAGRIRIGDPVLFRVVYQ